MIRRSKYKYQQGGLTPQAYGQLGQAAGDLYDAVTPTSQYGVKSDLNAGLSGALKGAGTGAAIGSVIPGFGTAIGAVVGGGLGLAGSIANNNRAKLAQQQGIIATDQRETTRSRAVLNNYQQGTNTNQIYSKYGGRIPYQNGGNLTQLSSDSEEVQGPTHEQGGVDIGDNIEVEGGETINKNFVFSEELGFAQQHKPIARAIGKIEKKPINIATRNSLRILKGKEEALKQEQESLKEQLGIPISR